MINLLSEGFKTDVLGKLLEKYPERRDCPLKTRVLNKVMKERMSDAAGRRDKYFINQYKFKYKYNINNLNTKYCL